MFMLLTYGVSRFKERGILLSGVLKRFMDFRSMFCCVKGSDRKNQKKKETTWRVFSLKELQLATNNFNYDNKLGEGGFGSVYWGQLWDGSQIAVKRLKSWSNKAEVEFSVEVEILARVRHKNLLTLRGYCAEGQERLIVYDYMTNLSLLSHLHGQHSAECHLDWTRRMNIAIGAAEGIAFGILLLELASGKKPLKKLSSTLKRPITEWALPLVCERKFDEIADQRLDGKYVEDELRRVVFVGLICAHNQPEKRPTILEVLELLKGDKEKFAALESDEMFKSSVVEDTCAEEFISDQKEDKQEIENV
ncbi:hypothetical protein DH2020_041375 [Rehmannia glutinosa]|uniref:Protein kinase domain-containing protein n=1 Tax=Rehmannia glutinosa TaxID=99300 RepID=A0ABR0URJ1_REHGL